MVATSALLSIGRMDMDDPLSSLVKYGQLGWRFEILVNNVPPASTIVLPAAGLEDDEMMRRVLTTIMWNPTNEDMRQARRAMEEKFRQLLSLWHRYSIVLGPTEAATEVVYLVDPHMGRLLWPDEDDFWRIFLLGRNIPSQPQHPDEATPNYLPSSATAEELMQAVADMIMEESTPDHLIMYEQMIEARVAEIHTMATP
jgi:hypothetical protein